MREDAVIDQTTETTPVETTEATNVETPVERTGPTRAEQIEALTGRDRERYKLTGKLPSERKAAAPTKELPVAEQSAKTEAASGPATTEQPPKDQRSRQDRNFKSLAQAKDEAERRAIAAEAKLEVYERERAASGKSAPAATTETKAPASDPRPEFPDIDKFETVAKFNAAVKEWQTKNDEWIQRQIDGKLSQREQAQQNAQATEAWNKKIEKARAVHPDYDAVVFNDTTPISWTSIGVTWNLPDGEERAYSLASNLQEATRIAELTLIPGENQFKTFQEFLKWVRSDPDRAMLYGEKVAIAKAELAKLSVGKAAPKPQESPPLKEVIAKASRPSAEVTTSGNAAPVTDPRAAALKNKDQKAYRQIMNERELRARRGR